MTVPLWLYEGKGYWGQGREGINGRREEDKIR
jgi:hypothetical protein